MNFLAHLFLSFDDEDVAIGNFVADSVKGEGLPQHSARIKTGIALHREIDYFTDHHPVVAQSKAKLWDKYRHYSAVLVDIFYDHYLSRTWSEWHEEDVAHFAQRHYEMFNNRHSELPEQVQHMLPYMIEYDWLTNYQYLEGMQRVLNGMSRRASFQSKMEEAVQDLRTFDSEFEAEFRVFFPELILFSKAKLEQLKEEE